MTTQHRRSRFPSKECKAHHFCKFNAQFEDNSNVYTRDMRTLYSRISRKKTSNLKDCGLSFSRVHPKELDFKHLSRIHRSMDDPQFPSSTPLITEEKLNDWCQQSLNRKWRNYPEQKPFLVP